MRDWVVVRRPSDGTTPLLYNIKPTDTALDVYNEVTNRAQQFFRPAGMEPDEVVVIVLARTFNPGYSFVPPVPDSYYDVVVPEDIVGLTIAMVAEVVSPEQAISRVAFGHQSSVKFVTVAKPEDRITFTRHGELYHGMLYYKADWGKTSHSERKHYLSTVMPGLFTPGTLVLIDLDTHNADVLLIGDDAHVTRSDFMHAASSSAGAASSAAAEPSSKKRVLDHDSLYTTFYDKRLHNWDSKKLKSFMGGDVLRFLPKETSLAQQLMEIRDNVVAVETRVRPTHEYVSDYEKGGRKRTRRRSRSVKKRKRSVKRRSVSRRRK
jgi:hypothetical protein